MPVPTKSEKDFDRLTDYCVGYMQEVSMSTKTIHTALLDIAKLGDDEIPLRDGLSLVRPNPQLLAHRWDWAQGSSEMEREEKETTRYLVCEYGEYVPFEQWRTAPERGGEPLLCGTDGDSDSEAHSHAWLHLQTSTN